MLLGARQPRDRHQTDHVAQADHLGGESFELLVSMSVSPRRFPPIFVPPILIGFQVYQVFGGAQGRQRSDQSV